MEKGYLKGKQTKFHCGLNHIYSFSFEELERFCHRYPFLMDINKIKNDVSFRSYYRDIVKKEYARDPWFNVNEVAPMVGVVTHDPVLRYIKAGWLQAQRRPGAGGLGEYVVRQSAIDAFLTADPRRQHAHKARSLARRRRNKIGSV